MRPEGMRPEEYTYIPAYSYYDDRKRSEKVLDITAPFMVVLFILAACWAGGAILLLTVPSSMWLIYWPLQLVCFIGEWGTFLGWPIWALIYVHGINLRRKERRK